jgi:anti-anti-sigma factor
VAVTLKQSKKSSTIRLQDGIDIASAAELKQLLLTAFAAGKEVRVDLASATDFDITAMQLLWAARSEAQSAGTVFKLVGQVPEPLQTALRAAGLDELTATATAAQTNDIPAIEVNS